MPSVSRRYAIPGSPFARPSGAAQPDRAAPVILMVSGGADSTALLVLAATSTLDLADGHGAARIARERLHVLHVNHGLRGINADEDEEFVRELADRFGIPCTVVRADVATRAAQSDNNVEGAGRAVRYEAAYALARSLSDRQGTPRKAARILTAHTADDRAETFLMNAIRGTGPRGLSSIPRQRKCIVRPLLDRTHAELCDFLRMRGIVWREDATNADTRYLRSYVRYNVLPDLRHRNPRLVGTLASTCEILSDEDAFLTSLATRVQRELTRRESPGLIALDAARLAATDVAVARRVVRSCLLAVCSDARLEARHIEAVLKAVAAGSGSVALPLATQVRVAHELLVIRACHEGEDRAPVADWLAVPGELTLPDGQRKLTARLVPAPPVGQAPAEAKAHGLKSQGFSVLLDAREAGVDPTNGGRLWVDTPHAGDVLCPLGMHGQSKKLSDLLGEAHIPLHERAYVPVVRTSPTGLIVWIAGIRADERGRCTPTTDVMLELGIELLH